MEKVPGEAEAVLSSPARFCKRRRRGLHGTLINPRRWRPWEIPRLRRILHRHSWEVLLKTEFLGWAQNKRNTRLKALCESPRSGHGSTLCHQRSEFQVLTSLSAALFFPWPAKRMEMFQLGEPGVEMVGEEQNPSLLKSTELSVFEKMCSLPSSGGERHEEEGKKKRGRDNEEVLVLIPGSQVQRMEPQQRFSDPNTG